MITMIIKIAGLFHLIHTPLLIVFPFIVRNFISDILYLIYFFSIMFSYTFINGECPISYMCKVIIDNKYIAGNNITHYPEMEYILQRQTIAYYFGIMTILYIATLFIVIFRTNLFSYFLIFTFEILSIYFIFIRSQGSVKRVYFVIVQEITKYILFFTICYLLVSFNNSHVDYIH